MWDLLGFLTNPATPEQFFPLMHSSMLPSNHSVHPARFINVCTHPDPINLENSRARQQRCVGRVQPEMRNMQSEAVESWYPTIKRIQGSAIITSGSTRQRNRRMWRGLTRMISAACTQLTCLGMALVITSRRVIARASRRTRRSIFSIGRYYPSRRSSLNVYDPDISNVYDMLIDNVC
jgi:hypothetical protein